MGKTKIEWTRDADGNPGMVWNPITGCTKVSEGCRNCYALTFAERWRGTPGHYFENGFDITLRPDKLDQPLRWKRPRRIFVNSMSDLFHPEVSFDFIDQVFAVMALCPQHTFQILTKRPERLRHYMTKPGSPFAKDKLADISPYMEAHGWISPEDAANIAPPGSTLPEWPKWPLPNVWLGVSVENQKAADERIPLLLQTPAAIRFLSCEPLLGPLDLSRWIGEYFCSSCGYRGNNFGPVGEDGESICTSCGADSWYFSSADTHGALDGEERFPIHQVIVGGESGHKARPMHPEWAQSLRDQCQAAGVAYFHKQNGEWISTNSEAETGVHAPGVFPGDVCISENGFIDIAKKDYVCFANRVRRNGNA